ncbi:MAG: phenylalanine--tRNA ligase subunit beta, partial [Limnobacter sp.]|nr:phenylalanine--tRNA ligase subunit beta [Limnobacter sp.]
DPSHLVEHLEWMSRLILDICGGQASPIDDQTYDVPEPASVTMRHARCEMVIGMEFSQQQIEKVFSSLGFDYTVQGGGKHIAYTVTAPSYRFDIQIEEDLIEEVIRVVGYESLPLRQPVGKLKMLPNAESRVGRNDIRRQLASLGYQEVVSYSFTPSQWESDLSGNNDPVELINPIASQLSVMRSTILGSLVSVLKHNLGHRIDRLRVFELARVFRKDGSVSDSAQAVAGYEQTWKIAGLAYGLADQLQWSTGSRAVDFFDIKGDVEQLLEGRKLQFMPTEHPALHPGRSAEVFEKGQSLGFIGELHPKWLKTYELPSAPIVFELDLNPLLDRSLARFSEVSKQPVVIRDLAFVVDSKIEAEKLKKAIQSTQKDKQGWLKSVILFDEFVPKEEGKGLNLNEKSLAFRLRFQASDQSLTDSDLEPILNSMIEQATNQCHARLR